MSKLFGFKKTKITNEMIIFSNNITLKLGPFGTINFSSWGT